MIRVGDALILDRRILYVGTHQPFRTRYTEAAQTVSILFMHSLSFLSAITWTRIACCFAVYSDATNRTTTSNQIRTYAKERNLVRFPFPSRGAATDGNTSSIVSQTLYGSPAAAKRLIDHHDCVAERILLPS